MHERTGTLLEGEANGLKDIDRALRREAGEDKPQLVPLSRSQFEKLREMTPAERKAWANRAKAERRARRESRRRKRRARRQQRRK